MRWFIEHTRPDDAAVLAGSLVPFWMATKRIAEGDAWFERILALSGSPARRGRALSDHGYLVFWAGHDERIQYDETVAMLTERMGESAFGRARAAGHAMPMNAGVEFALGDGPPRGSP